MTIPDDATTETRIFIDGDACPVKAETYRVASRYGLKVFVVANDAMHVPPGDAVELVVVKGGFNAADDWIVEHIGPADIAITADIPLAARCVAVGAAAVGPKGNRFTEDSIGSTLATRDLMESLRQGGWVGGGPAPFAKTDRSRFLAKLDETVHAVRRRGGRK